MWLKKVLAWQSLALVISLSQCTGACWDFALESIKLPFILSGVCSPSEANYCSNPFEVFMWGLEYLAINLQWLIKGRKIRPAPYHHCMLSVRLYSISLFRNQFFFLLCWLETFRDIQVLLCLDYEMTFYGSQTSFKWLLYSM